MRWVAPSLLLLVGCTSEEPAGTGSPAATSSSSGASGGGASSGTAGTGGVGGRAGSGGGPPTATVPFVYVGADDGNISLFLLDRATGALQPKGAVPAGANPSFLATDPQHRFVVAVDEGAGELRSFSIDVATGLLAALNEKSSMGNGPAYVSVDWSGAWALVANYSSGTVAVLPIGSDGSLGDAVDVESPGQKAHLIRTDPSNAFAFVPCLGSDHVAEFHFAADTGQLSANAPASVATAPGAGPRHLEFHPKLPVVYVINELGDTVVTYSLSSGGTLDPIDTQPTLPNGVDGSDNACANLHVSSDGNFLYGTNRGDDSLVIYSVDPTTGKLTIVGHQGTDGATPRNFGIDPAGDILLVANQGSSTIVTFRIDHAKGTLTQLTTTQTSGHPAWVGVITQADAV